MKVIATAEGYDNHAVRKPGEEFDMPEGSSGPWFKKVEDDAKGPKSKVKAGDKPADEPIA